MHPAHVPLERESESAVAHRARSRRGHAVDSSAIVIAPGRVDADGFVELFEKRDRLEVFAAAVAVREPLARFAAVVEVEHRCDRVDAQAVDMEFLEPIQRVGNEEIRTSLRPKLKTSVPQSGCSPRRGSSCSYSAVPSKRRSA